MELAIAMLNANRRISPKARVSDEDGCDCNAYHLGEHNYYGAA